MNGLWTMPEWMKSLEQYFNNTGGNTVEDLMTRKPVSIRVNAPLALVQMAVEAQVGLLERLHKEGLLRSTIQEESEPDLDPKELLEVLEEAEAVCDVVVEMYRPLPEEKDLVIRLNSMLARVREVVEKQKGKSDGKS